ncbi:MAG: N-acetylneuraminate synthase family protein [Elusimicrobia bacterium]|nr:N-acetylneuraminate synthase family protein [Elusimicrobiota bacterium]
MLDAGVNHNNDVSRAKELIRSAKAGGADAIKFQTYRADEISTKSAPRYWDPTLDTDGGGTQFEMFSRVDDLPKKAYYELKEYAREQKILFASSPFGMDSARFLKKLDIDFFKIASAEITNHLMIEYIADCGKPMVMSTGAASVGEVEKAIDVILRKGNRQIALQHCVLSYPCKDEDANLAKMVRLKQIFPDIPIGYSDHTYGGEVSLAAVALGARSIEKHYTIDSNLPDSPDHKFALTSAELAGFVKSCRRVEKNISSFQNAHYAAEDKAFQYARKSLVAIREIKKGQVITDQAISCKRPGTGIYPEYRSVVVGRTAIRNIGADELLSWEMF